MRMQNERSHLMSLEERTLHAAQCAARSVCSMHRAGPLCTTHSHPPRRPLRAAPPHATPRLPGDGKQEVAEERGGYDKAGRGAAVWGGGLSLENNLHGRSMMDDGSNIPCRRAKLRLANKRYYQKKKKPSNKTPRYKGSSNVYFEIP